MNAQLDKVKIDNDVSSSWTPAQTNAKDPLAYGNTAAERLAARGFFLKIYLA